MRGGAFLLTTCVPGHYIAQSPMKKFLAACCPIALFLLCSAALFADGSQVEWPFYGGDPGGMKYSPLADVNANNVAHLRVAWTWKTGEVPLPQFGTRPGMFENTPLMIDGVLYLSTPYNKVVALDAETGRAALDLRSENLRGWPATQRHRLRPSRSRGLARCRQTAHFPEHALPPDLPRREIRPACALVWQTGRRGFEPRPDLAHQ